MILLPNEINDKTIGNQQHHNDAPKAKLVLENLCLTEARKEG